MLWLANPQWSESGHGAEKPLLNEHLAGWHLCMQEALACVGKRFSHTRTRDWREQNFIQSFSTHALTSRKCESVVLTYSTFILFWQMTIFYFFLSPVGKWALNCEDENRYLSHKVLNTWHTHTQMYSITQTQMLHTNWETAVPRSLHHGITQSLKCGRMSNICSLTAKFSKQPLIILFNFYSFLFIPPTQTFTRKYPLDLTI